MRQLILVAHNIRSAHNVGSLLRTCEGLGVERVFLTGYTPYPACPADKRLPHLAQKTDRQIAKTALGAEKFVAWEHGQVAEVLSELKRQGFVVAALEQAAGAVQLNDFRPPGKLAIVAGHEVEGLETKVLAACDTIVEIPMFGRKESYNVAIAAAMALYASRFQR